MEKLVFQPEFPRKQPVDFRLSIFGFPDQLMAKSGQMGPDLMGTSGQQIDFQISERLSEKAELLKRPVFRTDRKSHFSFLSQDLYLIGTLVFQKPAFRPSGFRNGSYGNGAVKLVQAPLPEQLV